MELLAAFGVSVYSRVYWTEVVDAYYKGKHWTGYRKNSAGRLMTTLSNILEALPDAKSHEIVETLAQEGSVLIERITSQGQRSEPGFWYEQKQHEWVLLLQGAARLRWSDGQEENLLPGNYVSIPAGVRHRVEWTDPELETVWLAVHYPVAEV
jgi:cupin 2 domain-containing protein